MRHNTDEWNTPYTMSWDHRILEGAETLWEVADAAGRRTLITHYPSASLNAPLKNGYVVAPGLHDAPFSYAGGMSYYLHADREIQRRIETPGEVMGTRSTDVEEVGAPPGSSVIGLKPAKNSGWIQVTDQEYGCELPIAVAEGQIGGSLYLVVNRNADGTFGTPRICREADGRTVLIEVPSSGWSGFAHFTLDGKPGAARFCVLSTDSDRNALHLVRTVVYATESFTQPAALSGEILNAIGPFYDRVSLNPVADEEHLELWLDELRYMGEWQVKVADHMQRNHGWDLHFSHWHPFDWINHPTANGIDPKGPSYDPDRAAWLMEAQRRTYIMADDILKKFLTFANDDDIICVMSDHGITPTHRAASVPDRLIESGLMTLSKDGAVDRACSVCYVIPARGCEVYVNLAGREPGGIVPPAEYESVQEKIINALLDWRDPATDKRPIALALKLQDAQIIGYWGSVSGDVVLVMNRGYGWGKAYDLSERTGETSIGDSRTAIHGSQIPTSETEEMTNMGCFLLAGPGVRAGYERDADRWGLMRMIDLAPTFARLANLRSPRHSIGAVLTDLLLNDS